MGDDGVVRWRFVSWPFFFHGIGLCSVQGRYHADDSLIRHLCMTVIPSGAQRVYKWAVSEVLPELLAVGRDPLMTMVRLH
jgi:hypothetical protein